ncbi:MAG: diguanylate cyclase [Peptococcaceae bacterium]|nr:diguanylate cyclase [Peptococcaceae bacterium]
MQRLLSKYLVLVIAVILLPILFINTVLHMKSAEYTMQEESHIKINQIEKILIENDADMKELQAELGQIYLTRAEVAAYMLQNHPDHIGSSEEIDKIAQLLQVDEIHVFNKDGVLYAGNKPQYYGMRMYDGEQISFFASMLEDTSLKLLQEVTPNSAESKLMQYVAVWQENKENIVQIGLLPERVMKEFEKNELSHVFSMVTPDEGTVMFVAERATGSIIGATKDVIVGCHIDEVGISSTVSEPEKGFWTTINGIDSFCVYEMDDDYYIGIAKGRDYVYQNVASNVLMIALCLALLGFIAVMAIRKCIDKLILRDIYHINEQLNSITSGDLDTEVHIDTTPEMHDLTHNINLMVKSLLDNDRYMSYIFDMTGTEAGVFAYTDAAEQVRVTNKVGRLLMLTEEETNRLTGDKALFVEKIQQIKQNQLPTLLDNKPVYCLTDNQERYLQIQTVDELEKHFGIIVDRTEVVREKMELEYERNYDLLTGLLNRRGFYHQIDLMIDSMGDTEHGVLMMLDMDYLKYINDTFGHANGDVALRAAAELLMKYAEGRGIAARLSGDEFVMFLKAESKDALYDTVDALQQEYGNIVLELSGQATAPLRFSGGYLFVNKEETMRQTMLKKADKALYRAKSSGRGKLLEYNEQLDGTEVDENE